MEIKFADSFFKSLKKIEIRSRWYWNIIDFLRYDLPQGIKNLIFFFPEIWRFRSWDYSYQLSILKKSLERLSNTLEFHGNEVEESRMKKVEKIKRAISILDNQANDNYMSLAEEKMGYKVNTDYDIFSNNEPEEIKEANRKIFDLSNSMEQSEWEELWDIIKGERIDFNLDYPDQNLGDGSDMRGWWD